MSHGNGKKPDGYDPPGSRQREPGTTILYQHHITVFATEEICHQLSNNGAKLVVADEVTWGSVKEALTLLKKPLLPTLLNFPPSHPTPQGHPNLRHLLDDKNVGFADMVEVS